MNSRLLLSQILAGAVLFGTEAQALDVQILGLSAPKATEGTEVAKSETDDRCGEFRLESVTFSVQPGVGQDGVVSVVDPKKQEIASQAIDQNSLGTISAIIRGGSDDQLQKEIMATLLRVKPDSEETEVIERVETDSNGMAEFTKTVPAGNYQIGVECGVPVLAYIPPVAGGLVVGGTALGVGLTTGGGSSTPNINRVVDVEDDFIMPPPSSSSSPNSGPRTPQNNSMGPVSQ